MSRLLVIAPLAAFLLLAGLLALMLLADRDPAAVPNPMIGQPVPGFALLPLAPRGGEGLATDDLRTGEPALVNVWASWCAPCRIEHPYLVALKRQGVTVHGINHRDEPGKAWAFLRELGDSYDRVGVDADGRASIEWGVTGVPETFVVAGDGTILARHTGAIDERVIREVILPALEKGRR